jgi:glycosyltransferase involved in cell wall biosynthesis
MTYTVTIYCPDHHLNYEPHTPDRDGVGGGVTARIRLARALARLGHEVTLVGNCSRQERVDDVNHVPYWGVREIHADVVVLTSSAGTPDLSPACGLDIHARLRVGWVHGWPQPVGVHDVGLDYLCACSNYIRRIARDEWSFPREKLFVCYNGVERVFYSRSWLNRRIRRNPYRLVFSGNPDKGLDAAFEIVRLLRARDNRFELRIFGGGGLYGSNDEDPRPAPGVSYHGSIGQRVLYKELMRSGFSINLQTIREGFGLTLAEAMAAGCVALASPIGAYTEVTRHGYDGFLVPGEPTAAETQRRAADLIWDLVCHPELAHYIGKNAQAIPWDMDTVARTWQGHWDWALGPLEGESLLPRFDWVATCPECGGPRVPLADGYHCTRCGRYDRTLAIESAVPQQDGLA